MVTVNPPPWERRPSLGGPAAQTLPPIGNLAGLNGCPPSNDPRDSGNWSLTSNSQRASNTSEVSSTPLTLPPIDASRNSPGESGNPTFSHSHSPVSNNFGTSTTSLSSVHTTPPHHYQNHTADGVLPTPSPSVSRRSSFDSRLGNLQLSSPVGGTPAASQVSLSSTLLNGNRDSLASQMQRERGIHSNSPGQPSHHGHEQHPNNNPYVYRPNENGLLPSTSRANATPTRTAPPIVGSSRYPYGQASHPNAPSPTKGLPWAFPDPDIALNEARANHDIVNGRPSVSSLPGSAPSSIYSANSSLAPPGHPHMPPMLSHQQLPQIGATHHHGLTTRRASVVGDVQPQSTPYSRTPELRVSHKLAERKRRKEMKELFDELRESLPAERGGKSSKWEVLTKAIEFVNHQKDTIADKARAIDDLRLQVQQYQKEAEAARAEAQHYRQQQMQQQQTNYHPPPPPHPNGNDGGYHPASSHANGPVKMQGLEPC